MKNVIFIYRDKSRSYYMTDVQIEVLRRRFNEAIPVFVLETEIESILINLALVDVIHIAKDSN